MMERVQPRRGPEQRREPSRWPAKAPARDWRRPLPTDLAAADDPLSRDAAASALEAALFSVDEPMTLRRLANLAGLSDPTVAQSALERLQIAFNDENSSFHIVELAGGFQLLTRPEFYPWLVRVGDAGSRNRLTPTMLETLAIIAYRQPIMRADLESIRGVHCADALRELMDRGLVRIAGRDNSLGRPILYGTTKRFLQFFGLRDLGELTPIDVHSSSAIH